LSTRTLALDLDGVVNSAVWFEKMDCDALSRRPIHHMIDPDCVERLNRLLEISGADVVISSSWRIPHSVEAIDAALTYKGFRGNIIGATPHNMPPRGREIHRFMIDHALSVDHLVILDDDSDMGALAHRHVKTSWSVGLTDADVEKALLLFGVPRATTDFVEVLPPEEIG